MTSVEKLAMIIKTVHTLPIKKQLAVLQMIEGAKMVAKRGA